MSHHGGFQYSKTFKIWNSRYSSFISISSKFELELNLTFRRKILLWYFCLPNHHHHQSDCNFKGPLIPSVEPFKAQFASKRSSCSVQKVLCVVIVLFFSFVCFSFCFSSWFLRIPIDMRQGTHD